MKVQEDLRISVYNQTFSRPYEGKCLPKDIKHLISHFEGIGGGLI
jgi:UDP-glucose 6-dehydrogenase